MVGNGFVLVGNVKENKMNIGYLKFRDGLGKEVV